MKLPFVLSPVGTYGLINKMHGSVLKLTITISLPVAWTTGSDPVLFPFAFDRVIKIETFTGVSLDGSIIFRNRAAPCH